MISSHYLFIDAYSKIRIVLLILRLGALMDDKIKYFTSGEIAEQCGINFNTIVRWAIGENKVSLEERTKSLS